eukprot:scaffold9720_cov28-Prasinocladus_malaysianus.AAC.1
MKSSAPCGHKCKCNAGHFCFASWQRRAISLAITGNLYKVIRAHCNLQTDTYAMEEELIMQNNVQNGLQRLTWSSTI